MKNKDEIIDMLMKELDSVYCDTCCGSYCDECRRKDMNWGISKGYAERLTNKILEIELNK